MVIHSADELVEFINSHTPDEYKDIEFKGHPEEMVDVIKGANIQSKARFILFYAKNYTKFANSSIEDVLITGMKLDKQDMIKILNLVPQNALNGLFTDGQCPDTLMTFVNSPQHYEHWLELLNKLQPETRMNAVHHTIESMI